jgi:predicted HD phosphohydrolase
MSDPRVRREIALRAAQMMYAREESEYFTAKRKAAKMVRGGGGSDRARDLPSNKEIREQILLLAELIEGDERRRELREMRVEALRFLRLLARWKPRLIGSVLTGHVRSGSDIDIHVFSDSPASVADLVAREGCDCDVERKRVVKHNEARIFTHIHVAARFPVELTVYARDKANYPFKSSITGKLIERANTTELETLLRTEYPEMDIELELSRTDDLMDPFDLYEMLLRPLEKVQQNPAYHPEGDALYHSLQVFELARQVRSYDQEFLLAALLHDVGKAIEPHDHVAAGLEALGDSITERTAWLIEHHMLAHECREGRLGVRARRRLTEHADFEDLMLLSEADQAGREPGVVVCTVEEAIDYLKALDDQ